MVRIVTVNCERYQQIFTMLEIPDEINFDDELWFEQDGATVHTAHGSPNCLRNFFPGCLIYV